MDLVSMFGKFLAANIGVGAWAVIAILVLFAIIMVAANFGGSHPSDHKHDW